MAIAVWRRKPRRVSELTPPHLNCPAFNDKSMIRHDYTDLAMKLKLKWPVDVQGYVIEKNPPPEPLPENASEKEKREWRKKRTNIDAGAFERIVPKGGRVGHYNPMEICGLYNTLAETLPTERRAIEFANRFGLLTNPDLETLENFFGLRDAVERLVAMGPQRGKRELGWVKRLDGEARQGYPTARYT
ncbi:MAG: hypothetical protein WA445_00035 [Pseudolabrys sp.]